MNRIKTTTTSTGTGNIVVSATPAARCRPLSDIAAGKVVRMLIEDEAGTDWELVNATIIDATSFSRGTVINGSAGPGVKVNWGPGTKTVFVAAVLVDTDIPFNATIPLDRPEIAYMAAYTMAGPLAFAAGANPVTGAHVVATIIGNGVDEPTYPGFVKHASSLAFNKTSGAKNLIQFLRTPGVNRYAVSQAFADVVATVTTPADTTAPTLTSPTSASTGTTTGSGSVTTNEGNGTLYWIASVNATESVATVKAGSSVAVSSTGSKAVTVTGLTAGTLYYLHFVQTDTAGNDSARITSASFTTAAEGDTTAPTLSSPTGTQTGETTASGTVSTNEANGTLYRMASVNAVESAATIKAAALTSTVTATGVQNVTFTGLTAATQYYAHYVHRDAAGNDSIVANSAAFTTASVPTVTYDTMTGLSDPAVVESGTSPKTYSAWSTAGSMAYGWGANWTKHFAPGVDGSLQFKVAEESLHWAMALMDASTGINPDEASALFGNQFDTYGSETGLMGAKKLGTVTAISANITVANGDIVKFERTGSIGAANTATLKFYVSKNNGSTFTECVRVTGFGTGAFYPRWIVDGQSSAITELQSTGLVAN